MGRGIIILVSFFSSVIGSICGIGGGVVIKPVLDSLGIMNVTTVSFLSGCTVLSMSIVSLGRNMGQEHDFEFDKIIATVLALGGVVGGIVGKELYQRVINSLEKIDKVGAIQAAVLMLLTIGTLIYSIYKEHITTKHLRNKVIIFTVGIILGGISAFLGIGGGPINLVVLYYLFSMSTKQAAMYSIYIIMFSQISSLLNAVLTHHIPDFKLEILFIMIAGGVLGGLTGSRINKIISTNMVDRLFLGLMAVIICINIYNIFCFI